MIPLRDNIPSRTIPVVNYAFIAACTAVFLLQLSEQPGDASLIEQFGMIPARVGNPDVHILRPDQAMQPVPGGFRLIEIQREIAPAAIPPVATLLTCIFLHGGWMHFIGNVWFLWIFGDNVEDRFGHGRYLLFYLGSGILASLAHYLSNTSSPIPTIGASGAIAGVMGAYFVLYPRALVQTVVPIVFFVQIVVLPAWLFLGLWFLMQSFQGAFSIGDMNSGGVAWWAHIGGFVAGFILAGFLDRRRSLRPRVEQRRPGTDRVRVYRVTRSGPWQ